MKLNSLLSTIGLACTGAVLVTSSAFAAEPLADVYIGGGLSYNNASGLGGKIDSALGNQGLGATHSTADSNSTNPNVHLGYQLNSNFAIEGSYDRIGTMNVQTAVPSTGDTASGTWKANGVGLSVVGKWPIDNKWSVYGRLGAEQWRTSLHLASNAGGATNVGATSTTTGLVTGLGTAYSLSRHVDATAEYTHYDRVGSTSVTGQTGINAFSLGVNYHFM